MKQFIFLFSFLLFPLLLFSQETVHVSGAVKASGEALPYANVKFTGTVDAARIFGTATGNDGTFSVELPAGIYVLEISFVGYAKYISAVEASRDMHLPDIVLEAESNMISEVVVRARTVTYKPGGYTVGISNNPFYKEQELDNILKLTPGTNMDPLKGITVYGKGVSKIYVNNREVRLSPNELAQYLKNFKGSDIRQIEVISSSGVEEDASAAGSSVLKITTNKIDDGGRVTVSGGYTFGFSSAYFVPNVNLQWRMRKWSAYLIGGATLGESVVFNTTDAEFYDSGMKINTESELHNIVKHNYRSTLGVGYDIDERNLISVEAFSRSALFSTRKDLLNSRKLPGSGEFVPASAGIFENDQYLDNLNLSFNYTHLFSKKDQLVFRVDRLQTQSKYDQKNLFSYADADDIRYSDLNDEVNLAYTAGLNYEKSFDKLSGKLTAGLKYSGLASQSISDYNQYTNGIRDDLSSYEDVYHYDEDVYAAYGKYAFTVGNFNTTMGLRIEHASVFPRSASDPDQSLRSDYTDFFPEAGVNWNYNADKGHSISLNYNRSIYRPYMGNLNPLIIRENDYVYTRGNPFLKPSYGNTITLRSLLFYQYLVNVSYSASDDGTVSVTTVAPGSDIVYTQPGNGMKSRNLNVYAECPLKMGVWGNVKVTGTYSRGESSYMDYHVNRNFWNTGLSGMFRLPYDLNLMVDLSYVSGMKDLFSKSYAMMTGNFIISRSFFARQLNMSLFLGDLFNGYGTQQQDVFSDNYYQTSKNNFNNQKVVLRASYTFKWGNKSVKINRADPGNSDEQGRLSKE